jgi:TolB-like protein/DNA-binding winged helix-turn-helix (wHTH) protein
MPTQQELENGFRLGDWEVLPARGILRRGEAEETPAPKVFRFLMSLAVRDGNLASKEDLVREVWDGYPIGDDSIVSCAAQLRKHFDGQGKDLFTNVRKRGYKLDVPVVPLMPEPQNEAAQVAGRKTRPKWRRKWLFAGVFVVLAVIVFQWPAGKERSIAVMPFENLSGDAANRYIADGFKLELLHTLSNIEGLMVKDSKVSFPELTAPDIADRLDVDYLLLGAAQIVGEELKITFRIEKGSNGKTESAGEVVGPVGAVFELQAQLAAKVRDQLVGKSTQQLISKNRDPNSAGFDRYIRGMHVFERRGRASIENLDAAIRLFEESIDLDPTFGPSYLALASAYALLPDYRRAPLKEMHDKALELVEKAVDVDPDLAAAASAVQGFVYHKQRRWTEAEEAYLRATTANLVDSTAFNWYSLMLANVGRLEDAIGQIMLAQEIDPSSAIINSRTGIIYTWLGESQRASEYFERASQLGASDEIHMLMIRQHRYEEAARLAGDSVEFAGGRTDWIEPLFMAVNDPALRDQALAVIDDAFSSTPLDPRLEIVARTMLDDVDGAMSVAMSLADADEFFEMDVLFLKELQPVRAHPDFEILMQRLGIDDYWRANNCKLVDDRVRCKAD